MSEAIEQSPPAWDFTAFLADFCAPSEPLCTHDEFYVLDAPRGSIEDDHETAPVLCRCGGLFIATIWKIDRPSEVRPMSYGEQVRYGAQTMTTAQAGARCS